MRLLFQGCAGALGVLVALVLAGALIFGVAVVAGFAQLPLTNIQRQVTTHSQQYVQTQQKVILDYYADWQSAPDAQHKAAAETEVCSTAALLDPDEYPAQAAPFIAASCN